MESQNDLRGPESGFPGPHRDDIILPRLFDPAYRMNIGNIIPPYQTAEYLRTLPAIRERCTLVHELAKQGKLQYFDYHPDKEVNVANFCIEIMKVCFITLINFCRSSP